MQKATRDELMSQLDSVSIKMSTWLAKAKAYQMFQDSNLKENQKSIYEGMGERAKSYLDKFVSGNKGKITLNSNEEEAQLIADARAAEINKQFEVMQASYNLDSAYSSALSRSVLLEGYEILNELGEAIRDEPIQYSITVTGSGDWSSAIPENTYTWVVDYSQFKSLITTSRTRLMLKDTSSIIRDMGNTHELWSQKRIDRYNSLHRNVNVHRLADQQINRGNTLEAFLLMESNPNLTIYEAIEQTLSHSIPFYSGGDIGNKQIKGMNASVTNFDTLINEIYRTYTQIETLKQRITAVSKKPPDSKMAIRMNDSINKAIVAMLSKYGFKQ